MESEVKLTLIVVLSFICILVSCGADEQKTTPNTAPVITLAEILPTHPQVGSRINLRIRAFDDDGDRISYAVNWFRNDRIIGSGLEFYLSDAEKGDRIYADIMPSDGRQSGETVRTTTVIVANTPPKIIGVKLEPEAIVSSTGELHITTEGVDPDADSLSYFCYWRLNDGDRMSDSSTTLYLHDLGLKKGMTLTSELYAYDGDTLSSPYVLEIEITNSAPMLSAERESIPYSPDSIIYVLPIVDPDGDNVLYELVDAPAGLHIDPTFGIVHGSVTTTEPFQISVRATDTEGAFLNARFTVTPPAIPDTTQ